MKYSTHLHFRQCKWQKRKYGNERNITYIWTSV